ncbi:MAG: serine/threonine protein kinase [Deltaproteobacteria bacterium]|nr:serine/threonine protein kinase [Deltaproteobacteria bacterium]
MADEGEPAGPPTGGQGAPAVDDAFAATIAPPSLGTLGAPARPPADLPSGTLGPANPVLLSQTSGALPGVNTGAATRVGRPNSSLESDQTIAAPGAAPPGGADELPIVSDAHYRADGEIARGGMGRIVSAQDTRLGRPVALKQLIEPEGDALGRFQREALITARLQHPGIVPVYEAGRFPSGEPFFAMKLVAGEPLDKEIAKRRTFEDRIELLPRVAAATEAIAYAHSQRVVHRDLKPGNVLLGDFGETVVIDWGLAKDLDAGDADTSAMRRDGVSLRRAAVSARTATLDGAPSTLTIAGAVMGTPAYMPPEQARGEAVDQRADVFALGAMLYHTLAGVPPYNARTATDVIAAAALGKVVPLREREDAVPHDLVAIVERAMAPIAADRYENAGELASDLRRFLTGQLVASHHYTAWQKLVRFLRKHRGSVTIGAIAVVMLAVGGTLAVKQIIRERDSATSQRILADARREAAEKLIDRMLSDVKDRLVAIGRLDLLANLGGQIRDYYGTLAAAPGGMGDTDLDRMASAIELIGRAERDSGQAERALKMWTQLRAQLAAAVAGDAGPGTYTKRRTIAHLDFAIGTIHQQRGGRGTSAALEQYRSARAQYEKLRGEQANDRETLLGAAENHDRLGDLLRNDGKTDLAFEEYSAAKVARERASSHASTRPTEELLALSTSHLKLGSVYQARGDSTTALKEYRASLRLRETVLEAQPDNVEIVEKVLDVQGTLAELQRQIGDNASAIDTYLQEVPTMDALLRRDPNNTAWRRARGNLMADLGFALLDSGEFQKGLDQLALAIEAQLDLVARDPKAASWQIDLSRSYTRAGDGHVYLGSPDDGIAKYQLALEIRKKLVARDPRSAPYRRSKAWSHAKLGNAHLHKGELAKAIEEHEVALALRVQLVADAPNQSGFKNELASSEIALGKLLAAKDPPRSAQLIAQGLARARALSAGDAINLEWKETVVQGLLATPARDVAARRTALAEALAIATKASASSSSAQWPGFLAEIHIGLAEIAPDPGAAAASWRAAREALEPLAKANRLSWTRKSLLERARAGR